MDRRRFLAASAAGVAALAGCGGNGGDGADGTDSTDSVDGDGGGDGDAPFDHPAATDLSSQPRLGPDPVDASGLIVAFEDPSCPRCRAFETTVVPKIRSNLVETGAATFVFRGYPVVYEWGDPATRALEATYARDPDAFWTLAAHYFENQGDFRGLAAADVYDRTRQFLAEETDLAADGVVASARGESVQAAVQTDLDAGMAAQAGRTTPHVFLFSDGEYRTKAAGSISYDVIASVLGT